MNRMGVSGQMFLPVLATRVVPDRGPLNDCVCVCMFMISAINFSVYYQLKVCMQVTWERYLSLCNLLSVSLFWWKIADAVG